MKQQQYVTQRAVDRVDMRVTALLVGKRGKLGMETGLTEDVSSRGARVASTSEWLVGEMVLVTIPGFHFSSAARVAYCNRLSNGRFGVGLEFVGAREPLEMAALVTALEFPSS